jgi:hypothetical protein
MALWSSGGAEQAGKTVAEMVKEQYALLVETCKPSAEQVKALTEKFKQKQGILEAWDAANGAKLQAAKEAFAAVRKGNDDDNRRKIDADYRALQEDRVHATYETECAIAKLLDAEQQSTWAGAQLAVVLMPKYGRAKPADEQWNKIKEACRAAGREIAPAVGDEKKEHAARANVERYVRWAIENLILTPDQVVVNNGGKLPPAKPPMPPTEIGSEPPATAAATKPSPSILAIPNPVDPKAPVVQAAAVVKPAPAAQPMPVVQTTPVDKTTPAVQTAPVVKPAVPVPVSVTSPVPAKPRAPLEPDFK